MKAADRRPWTAGGRPGRQRAWRAGRPTTGPERAGWRGAGRTRVTTPAWGGLMPRGIEADAGGGGATGRGRAVDDAGTGGRRRATVPRSHPPHPPGDR